MENILELTDPPDDWAKEEMLLTKNVNETRKKNLKVKSLILIMF